MRTICPDHAFSRGSVWSLGFHIPSDGPRRGTETCSYGGRVHRLTRLFFFFCFFLFFCCFFLIKKTFSSPPPPKLGLTTCPSRFPNRAEQKAGKTKKGITSRAASASVFRFQNKKVKKEWWEGQFWLHDLSRKDPRRRVWENTLRGSGDIHHHHYRHHHRYHHDYYHAWSSYAIWELCARGIGTSIHSTSARFKGQHWFLAGFSHRRLSCMRMPGAVDRTVAQAQGQHVELFDKHTATHKDPIRTILIPSWSEVPLAPGLETLRIPTVHTAHNQRVSFYYMVSKKALQVTKTAELEADNIRLSAPLGEW